MDYERDPATHENLHHRRTVPIDQIHVQDRRAYGIGRKERQRLRTSRGWTDDLAANVLDGKRQVQGYERLILGHKNGYIVKQ